MRSISVPLRDGRGDVLAAIKVVAPANRASPAELERDFLPILLAAAREAEAVIRAHDPR